MWNSDLCPMPHTKARRFVKGIWRRCGQAWPLIGLIALYLHLHAVIDCKSCCVQCGLGSFIEFATAFCGERCYYKWEMVCVIFIRWPGVTGISNPGTLGMISAMLWKSRTLGTQPRCHPQRVQRHLGLQEPRNGGLSTSLSFVHGYFWCLFDTEYVEIVIAFFNDAVKVWFCMILWWFLSFNSISKYLLMSMCLNLGQHGRGASVNRIGFEEGQGTMVVSRYLQRLELPVGEYVEGMDNFSGTFPFAFSDVTLKASRVQQETKDTCAFRLTHGQMLGSHWAAFCWVSQWESFAFNFQLWPDDHSFGMCQMDGWKYSTVGEPGAGGNRWAQWWWQLRLSPHCWAVFWVSQWE